MAAYAADRLWYATPFTALAWAAAFGAWALAFGAVSLVPWSRRGAWGRAGGKLAAIALSAAAGALALKALCGPFTVVQAEAFALLLGSALAAGAIVQGLVARRRAGGTWEGLRFAIAQGAALFAVHPYVRSCHIGAGDAYSYSLMVADFREQVGKGVFPVFIGQSWFAFNGGFQPIRNAPYFQHLAALLDLGSLGTLSAFALQNLTVLVSMLGAVAGCYAALRLFLRGSPWVALGLAVLYGLCPGVLAPLYGGDMYLTFMTLPFVPWLFLGIAESAVVPGRLWPWGLQAGALAGMWLAHPPVAAWATMLAVASAAWTAARDRRARVLGRMAAATALFLVLSAGLFVSVHALQIPAVARADALASVDYKLLVIGGSWRGSLLPVSHGGNALLTDIQLGYGLWACLLLAAAGAARLRSGRRLAACFVLVLVFAWPVPFLTAFAWRSLPSLLLSVTNQWPVERLYVLLAGLSVFIAAAGLERLLERGGWRRRAVGALVLIACLWSASETVKFFRRGAANVQPENESEATHLSENIVLSRTHSVEIVGTPAYFTFGHMDPRLETRLLDRQTGEVVADGTTRLAGAADAAPAVLLRDPADGFFAGRITLGPRADTILRFDFLGARPSGELQVMGASISNVYPLPSAGLAKAFGAAPGNGRTLILRNSTGLAEEVSLRFLGQPLANGVFARVSADPMGAAPRAITLESLVPFRAGVSAARDSFLETPRLFVPGYEAVVDGTPVVCTKSPEGLVEVAVPRGRHEVTVSYPGSPLLKWSYAVTAAAWLLLLGAIGATGLAARPRQDPVAGT